MGSSRMRIIRKLKYVFLRLGLHRLLPGKGLVFLGQLARVSKWVRQNKDLKFTSFPAGSFKYNDRFNLYKFIVDSEIGNDAVDYFEFGVSKGVSFRWWVDVITHPQSSFFGFDTFTGLPEAWGPFKKGAMSNGNTPPIIDGNRHHFYQGIFQKTLPDFLKSYQSDRKKIILMDADLFSSTLFVLTSISSFLRKGDVIIFDEFNVPMHEFKAFDDWVHSYYIDYQVLGEVNNFYCTAIKIK